MSDVNPDSKDESKEGKTEGVNFSERYSDVMGKVNESLSKIDWTQMGKYGKAAGIIAVVVLAQVVWLKCFPLSMMRSSAVRENLLT